MQNSALIPAPRYEVFDYLTDIGNLPFLLAPTIEVQVLSPEVPLKRGSEFHFMMTRFGLGQNVRLRVEDMLRGSRLTYRQSEGLFYAWTHTMRFEEHDAMSTLVTDLIDYELPLGLLGAVVDDLLIKRDMTFLLNQRLEKAKEFFAQA